jgi:hypothetical protein
LPKIWASAKPYLITPDETRSRKSYHLTTRVQPPHLDVTDPAGIDIIVSSNPILKFTLQYSLPNFDSLPKG